MVGTEESVNWIEQKDPATGTCGNMKKIFMLLEPEEWREGRAKKIFEEIFFENDPHWVKTETSIYEAE